MSDEDLREAQRAVLDDPSDDSAWETLLRSSSDGRVGAEATQARIAWLARIAGAEGDLLHRRLAWAIREAPTGHVGPWVALWPVPDSIPQAPAGLPTPAEVRAGVAFAALGNDEQYAGLISRISDSIDIGPISDSAMVELHNLATSAVQRHQVTAAAQGVSTSTSGNFHYTLSAVAASWFGVSYTPPRSGTVIDRLNGVAARVMAANLAWPPSAGRFSLAAASQAAAAGRSLDSSESNSGNSFVGFWTAKQVAALAERTGSPTQPRPWSAAGPFLSVVLQSTTVDVSLLAGETLASAISHLPSVSFVKWGFHERVMWLVQCATRRNAASVKIPHMDALTLADPVRR